MGKIFVGLTVLLTLCGAFGLDRKGEVVTAAEFRIAVVTSQEAPPYQEIITGARHYLESRGVKAVWTIHALRGDATKAAMVAEALKSDGADLLLTLGSLATRAIVRVQPALPLLASLVVTTEELTGATNATAVVLEFSVETQLYWLRRLLPHQQRIGVLFNLHENQRLVAAATRVAATLGLTLFPYEVSTPQDLPAALDAVAKRADVLWSIPDQTVLSPETAEHLLTFSFRNRIPFTGLSAAWVKAGALYALDRDYGDIGAQCGELAEKILRGTPANSLPPVGPRRLLYSVNLKTASHMKLDIPEDLLAGAQQVFR
ncbi:MAG: ABC transporter substrate-binding protein [Candidatus Binatia bacterium]